MASYVWLNIILSVMVISAIVGIPLWMTFNRPERAPDHTEAKAYLRAKALRARTVATIPAPAPAGLSTARRHAAATRGAVPGRKHSAATTAPRRSHAGRQHTDVTA